MDPPPTSTLRDPGTLFFQKDGIRRSIISSYWAAIILSLPLWWYFTSIERLTLPSSRVQQLAQQHLTLPISVCIEANTSLVNQVQSILTARIAQEPQRWRGLAVRLEAKAICGDKSESETYSIISNNGPPYIRDRRLYFPLDEPNSPLQLVNALSSLLVPYSSSSDPEHRVVQYSPHYRLAFSLLNEDAAAGGAVMNWNILGSIESHIKPILSRLSPLHNFTIESQVQFHAPLAFSPYPLERDHSYGIKPSDLTVFVNSAEWTLSSSSSNDPVLHFILFIPSIRRRPLRILLSDDTPSASYAFLLPQWGGIVIHNPPGYLNNDEFSPTEHHSVFSSFSTQLLALLGAPPLPHEITRSTTDRASLSDWQLDALIRRRALENAQGSQDTLQSIVKLVDQIENMPVGEDVRDDIEDALVALANMYESSSTSLRQAFAYSVQSFGLASRAFFNPGMLALLYFPAEHKYAVYTPLFASALTPIFVAALREFLAWKRARRAKNEKKAS